MATQEEEDLPQPVRTLDVFGFTVEQVLREVPVLTQILCGLVACGLWLVACRFSLEPMPNARCSLTGRVPQCLSATWTL